MTSKRRHLDSDKQAEAVMYPFVLIIAFMIIVGTVIMGLSRYAQSGVISTGETALSQIPFGLYNFTTVEADNSDPRYVSWGSIEGYEVTPSDILDHVPYPTDDDPFEFSKDWDDKYEQKYLHVIMDNRDYEPGSTEIWKQYKDFIAVRREAPAGVVGLLTWGMPGLLLAGSWYNAVIPFESIVNNYISAQPGKDALNVSITDFQIGKSVDSLFVNTTLSGEANFSAGLWSGNFFIYYGWSLFRIENVDFWGAMGMLLIDDIPGVHPMVNFIFHAFAIGTITFVLFTMGLRIYDAVVPL